MEKRGYIWVSAVLYMALGIVAITLILTAGLPLINNMKDRNTVIDTKELMFVLDDSIRTVITEGPGSQRALNPFVVKKGEFVVDETFNDLNWSFETQAVFMEVGESKKEGNLDVGMEETNIEGRYKALLGLSYDKIAKLKLNSQYKNPFSGEYSVYIKNTGEFVNELPVVEIRIN